MPKEKKVKKNDIKNDALNSEVSAVETDETTKDDLGSPTYEELVDINEELEKSVFQIRLTSQQITISYKALARNYLSLLPLPFDIQVI